MKARFLGVMLFGCLLSLPAVAPAQQPNGSKHVLQVVKASPSDQDVAKAVAKGLIAWASHEAGKPQPCDGVLEDIARAAARATRDSLIDSDLEDLAPTSKAAERAAVRNL